MADPNVNENKNQEEQTQTEEKPVGFSWADTFAQDPAEQYHVFTVSGPYKAPGQPV